MIKKIVALPLILFSNVTSQQNGVEVRRAICLGKTAAEELIGSVHLSQVIGDGSKGLLNIWSTWHDIPLNDDYYLDLFNGLDCSVSQKIGRWDVIKEVDANNDLVILRGKIATENYDINDLIGEGNSIALIRGRGGTMVACCNTEEKYLN